MILDNDLRPCHSPVVSDAENCAPCVSRPDVRETRSDSKPWEAENVSRATWFRRAASWYRRSQPTPTDEAPRPVETAWYCVRTGPAEQHLTADIELRQAGWELFNPSLFKPATPPRRINGIMQPGKPDRVAPLFPRYLFTRFHRLHDPWGEILRLPGVQHILGPDNELPSAVPDGALEAIRGLCMPNGCIYESTPKQPPIALGTVVRLTTGPMLDHAGLVRMSDGQRVQLLLSILGREVQVTVSQLSVVRVTNE